MAKRPKALDFSTATQPGLIEVNYSHSTIYVHPGATAGFLVVALVPHADSTIPGNRSLVIAARPRKLTPYTLVQGPYGLTIDTGREIVDIRLDMGNGYLVAINPHRMKGPTKTIVVPRV